MPGVLTIVSAFNHERFVRQAVESALMQRCTLPHKVVVLDDCSQDRTPEILQQLVATESSRLLICRSERNECSNRPLAELVRRSDAQYVALLDADDYWISDVKIQRQVEFLETNPDCAMCFHNVRVRREGEPEGVLLYNDPAEPARRTIDDLLRRNFIAGCSALLRRDAIRCLPEWYHDLPFGEWPLYLVASLHGDIGFLPEALGVYRIHAHGLWSSRTKREQLRSLIGFVERMNLLFDSAYDGQIRAAVRAWHEELEQE